MDNFVYRVKFSDYAESGQAWMTELVSNLIRGGTEGLTALADPVIPELRSDVLPLYEARLDPDFGAFVPINSPAHAQVRRFITQHENAMLLTWDAGVHQVRWQIFHLTEEAQTRIISVDERERYDSYFFPEPRYRHAPNDLLELSILMNPVFLAEEMTLDVVRARARWIDADWLGDRDPYWLIEFSVLFDDILVHIVSSGASAEEIWIMLTELLEI